MKDTRFDPCPFCGGAEIHSTQHYDSRSPTGSWFSMCCYSCGAHVTNRANIEIMIELWNRRAGTPISKRGAPCDIYPDCHSQGCTADPFSCLCVRERDTAFKDLDDIGRWRKLQFHLRQYPGVPIPAEWVEWVLPRVTPPKDEGVRVHTSNPEKPDGWVRAYFVRNRT